MKDYFTYDEDYNIDGPKCNKIKRRISFDAVDYIDYKKIGNPTTKEMPYFKVLLRGGIEAHLPLSSADEFIKEYDRYKSRNVEALIQSEIENLFEPEQQKAWWNTPNKKLNYETPRAFIDSGKALVVLDYLRGVGR